MPLLTKEYLTAGSTPITAIHRRPFGYLTISVINTRQSVGKEGARAMKPFSFIETVIYLSLRQFSLVHNSYINV